MNITLAQIRAFIAVARERSFTRAADRLSTTQPSVSAAIKQLEAALNLRLFDRTTKELHLTAEARAFLPTIERLNDDLDAAVQDLIATAERRRGRVSVAVLPSIATNVLPATISTYSAAYPNIRISLRDDNTTAIWQQVRSGEVELGIAGRLKEDDGLDFETLIRDPFGAVMHPDHPLAADTGPINWDELADFPFISFGLDTGIRPLLDTIGSLPDNIVSPWIEGSNIATVLALLKANLGIAALPKMAMGSGGDDLLFRTLLAPPLYREIGLVTREKRSLSPAALGFVEHLRTVLKPQWLS